MSNIFTHIKKHGSDDVCEFEYADGSKTWRGAEFIPDAEPEPEESYDRAHRAKVLRSRVERGEDLWCDDDVVMLADAHRETGRGMRMMEKMRETYNLRLPSVGENVRPHGKLVEVQDVTPTEPILDYVFETTEATLVGRSSNVTVVTFSTFNNLYGNGPNACVQSAIKEAGSLRLKLPEIEFVVIKTTSQVRMRPSDRRRENPHDKGMLDMHALEWGRSRGLPDDVVEEVWSSTRGWLSKEVGEDLFWMEVA